MTKITAVMNAHREGLLAGPSIASFAEAREYARDQGIEVEGIFILDRSDRLTKDVISQSLLPDIDIYETDFGDLSSARNFGAQKATGEFVGYLDADDLWSFNWLAEATRFCLAQDRPMVAHSEINILFGDAQNVWIHADSTAADFDPTYLTVGNYWDSMSFSPTETLLKFPFHRNELRSGYGYEDWHWNCVTLLAGIPHRPVPDTVHFKRRRGGSLLASSAESDVVPAHTGIYAYARRRWEKRSGHSQPAGRPSA